MSRARWMVAPGGRVAHRWEPCGCVKGCSLLWLACSPLENADDFGPLRRPSRNTPKCARCLAAQKRERAK